MLFADTWIESWTQLLSRILSSDSALCGFLDICRRFTWTRCFHLQCGD